MATLRQATRKLKPIEKDKRPLIFTAIGLSSTEGRRYVRQRHRKGSTVAARLNTEYALEIGPMIDCPSAIFPLICGPMGIASIIGTFLKILHRCGVREDVTVVGLGLTEFEGEIFDREVKWEAELVEQTFLIEAPETLQ